MGGLWISAARASLHGNQAIAVLVPSYVLVVYGFTSIIGNEHQVFLFAYTPIFLFLTLVMASISTLGRLVYVLFTQAHPNSVDLVRAELSYYLKLGRVMDLVLLTLLLSTFMSAFISLKNQIPSVHPYDWDPSLMALDNALNFGIPPWRLLQPILAYPLVTGILSIIYGSWIVVLIGTCFWLAVGDVDRRLRTHFFVSFFMCFVLLGNVVATGFASGGPCFYGFLVDGPDPYLPLMQYLRIANQQVPINWSLAAQAMLWHNFSAGSVALDTGISAMPSIHVAGATLCALLGWRMRRRLGAIFTVYTLLIMIGSVHLAWHYAIDGYVALFGTLAIWWAVGLVLSVTERGQTGPDARHRYN